MNRDKQIDEMAMVICENTAISCYETAVEIAEELIDKGYRKASEAAEEIFAEIEKARMQHTFGDIDGSELNVRLYYLKKEIHGG